MERLLAEEVSPETVAAIVIEPVQGEGGFLVAPPTLLRRLRAICDQYGIVLIADEVQTGFGRTGRMFSVEHAGVVPDLMVLAKSLAAGMPLGAVVGRSEIMDAPGPGGIGGTFGGNPLACRAALAVLDLFEREDLPARAARIGEPSSSASRTCNNGSTWSAMSGARAPWWRWNWCVTVSPKSRPGKKRPKSFTAATKLD